MNIDFLDNKFPKECKTKLFKLEEYLNKKTKNKSYKFGYNTLTNEIEIFVRFPYDLCISNKYRLEEFIDIPVDILYKTIEISLYEEFKSNFFINEEEE